MYKPRIFIIYTVPADCHKNLTIGAYVPGPCWNGGSAVKTVIELALKQVNERTDILPGYRLNVILNDTKVCTKKLELSLANESDMFG